MALDAPISINNHDYTSNEFRRATVGFFGTHENTLVSPRPGVLSGFIGSVSGSSVSIGSGLAIVSPGSDDSGAYSVSNAGGETLMLTPRDSAYTRWDVVGIRIYNNADDGLGKDEAALEVYEGEASASPAEPSLPQGVLPLWRVVVPPGVAPLTVVDRRQFTVAPGGVLPCTSTNRPTPGALFGGFTIWQTDTKSMHVWNGSAWDPVVPVTTDIKPHGQVFAHSTLSQSVTDPVAVQFNAPTSGNLRGGMTWSSSSRGFVIPRAGRYAIQGNLTYATGVSAGATIWASARIRVNGIEEFGNIVNWTTNFMSPSVSGSLYLQPGDVVVLIAQTAGSAPARSIHTTAALTYLTVSYIGE